MGSKIELLRMTVYVFFPVAVFYYFNMPNFYEDYVQTTMGKLYPPKENYKKLPMSLEELKLYEQSRQNKTLTENGEER